MDYFCGNIVFVAIVNEYCYYFFHKCWQINSTLHGLFQLVLKNELCQPKPFLTHFTKYNDYYMGMQDS